MPRNSMPKDWEPPAPAWQSLWQDKEDLIAGYFGIQAEQPTLLEDWAAEAFTGLYAPELLEQGKYIDKQGVKNHLYIAYWRRSSYLSWWNNNGSWWADSKRENEPVGYWREIILFPHQCFETLYSSQHKHGIGKLSKEFEGPIKEHGYAGGARDRIPLSQDSPLKNIDSVTEPLVAVKSECNKRIQITPPEHMCVIRSGQDWQTCESEEEQYYLEKVHPVLIKGMNYLRDNPKESNCYLMRFVEQTDDNWNAGQQTFGLGYATDIYAFEEWAKSHPTHLAIFGNFMQMVEQFGADMKLQLWHEMAVLPADGCEFEYIGCHHSTGLLSYI